jgi:uncharacterized RDD family membrane protein YckC
MSSDILLAILHDLRTHHMSDPNSPLNPFAPPQSQVQDVPSLSANGLVLASRGRRLAGALLDGLIALLFCAAIFISFSVSLTSLSEVEKASWMVLPVYMLVQGYLLATRGQSLAKMILGTRIVRPDGSPVGAVRIVGLRFVLPTLINMIPVIGGILSLVDSLMIFRDSRRCLHDDIADTIVVKI